MSLPTVLPDLICMGQSMTQRLKESAPSAANDILSRFAPWFVRDVDRVVSQESFLWPEGVRASRTYSEFGITEWLAVAMVLRLARNHWIVSADISRPCPVTIEELAAELCSLLDRPEEPETGERIGRVFDTVRSIQGILAKATAHEPAAV